MFTFVIISYNQEHYIIGHLESIKFQIERFGRNQKINLILSDDCSTDQTVHLAEIWFEENQHLFNEIQIIVNKKNQGIVKNYLLATASIKTAHYKILGADDLYHMNNIFETIDWLADHEVIFTPALTYNETGVKVYWDINNLLTFNTKAQVKNYLKHSHPFNAVGTFYQTSLIQEAGLRDYISQYTWIEDLPSVYYLFNEKEQLDYSIVFRPYVIYRDSVGVSRNEKNDHSNQFVQEEIQIKKDLGMAIVERGLNLDYLRVAFEYKAIDLQANFLPKHREIKRNVKKEIAEARKHIDYIHEKELEFFKTTINNYAII